jgi:hypothetical protein
MRLGQELVECAGPPTPGAAELENLANHRRCCGVWAGVRSMRAIGQTFGPEPGIAAEPLVTRLAADAIAPAGLSKGGGSVLGIEHEALTLVHG